MSILKAMLSEIMTDNYKSARMMYGKCSYDPEFRKTVWDIKLMKSIKTGEIIEVSSGYGKEFDDAGISYELMDHYGGEGQGDDFWAVWKFTKGNQEALVKFEGWYASYHGAEFTEWRFVEPKKVTVTKYV